ncbi:hypothetical protein HY623_04025 [Candidatus Uhrbacteria bacterium]|nr:hypothetical protein [Candidatus Uhrbacteria bacterium]
METATLTIPKKLAQMGNLILIPQEEYEDLLRVHKKYKNFYEELDRRLEGAIRSYRKGKTKGPFRSVVELKKSLEQ